MHSPDPFQFAPLLPRYPIIPNLLPRQSISLLVGAPYSGKTALILPALSSYLQRGEMLDLAAPRHPELQTPMLARTGCLTCDQTADELQAHLAYLSLSELTPATFPIVSWHDVRDGGHYTGLDPTLSDLYALFPEPRPQLLLIEDIQTLMPSGKVFDRQEVKRFVAALKLFCRANDVTILGTVPQAKAQPDQAPRAATERVYGSIMWVNAIETVLSLEAPPPTSANGYSSSRVLEVTTRSTATRRLYYDFNDLHQLVPTLEAKDWRTRMAEWLQTLAEGAPIPKQEFTAQGKALGVSEPRVEDWLTEAVRTLTIERVKKGIYRRPYRT